MIKTSSFLVAMLFLALSHSLLAQNSSDPEPLLEFAAVYSNGEKWEAGKTPAEQPYFMDHSAFLFRLKQSGVITAGIKIADKSIILFKAKSLEEAKKLFAPDVSVDEKTYKLEVQSATVFYKGCI
ncbi:MAG: hypothetical protein RIE86_01605 [Imperialibacter sp.]|uniref:hypothetical protein n=1 Tax=Imperialibacter sp. TaxID=2038411 RepID=UPI0032EB3F5B